MNWFILTLAFSFGVTMFIVVPLVGARWIYRDAWARGLNAPMLYALMAFMVPFYLGFIFYVLKIDALDSATHDDEPT